MGGGGPREQRDRPGVEVMGRHAPRSNVNRLQNKGVWAQGRIPKPTEVYSLSVGGQGPRSRGWARLKD